MVELWQLYKVNDFNNEPYSAITNYLKLRNIQLNDSSLMQNKLINLIIMC